MILANVLISKVLISVYKINNNKTLNHWKNFDTVLTFPVLNFWKTLRTYYMDEKTWGSKKLFIQDLCFHACTTASIQYWVFIILLLR